MDTGLPWLWAACSVNLPRLAAPLLPPASHLTFHQPSLLLLVIAPAYRSAPQPGVKGAAKDAHALLRRCHARTS